MWDIVWVSPQEQTPCLSTGTAMPLIGAETVQERPLLSWKGETRLPDCGVVHQVGIDHRSRLPGFRPLTFAIQHLLFLTVSTRSSLRSLCQSPSR